MKRKPSSKTKAATKAKIVRALERHHALAPSAPPPAPVVVRLPRTPAPRRTIAPSPSVNKDAIELEGVAGESEDETRARVAFNPAYSNALVARTFAQGGVFPGSQTQMSITACTQDLADRMGELERGDTSEIERHLIGQAFSLQAIFGEMSRRAALNMGERIEATETYLRLALRAQSQARATLETLAEIKNPRPVYINPGQVNHANGSQQVNNATGPQQVNNGIAPPVREKRKPPNKLLEVRK